MKKNEKIMILVLFLILAIMCVVLFLTKSKQKTPLETGVNSQNSANNEILQEGSKETNVRAIMVNGKVYYDSGKNNNGMLRCGVMDGKITSNIEKNKIPTVDNQANFEGEYDYQYGTANTIEVRIDDDWIIFETEERRGLELKVKVYDKAPAETAMIRPIISAGSKEEYDYSVYGYEVFVNVVINGTEMSLKSALDDNKISMQDIFDKAKEECKEPIIYKDRRK
ncbi:MAG: hypothetical protein HFJ50_09690 [Clostridia bacterium]|jgi:hypothetical protein|nr:hypothetical protein [Clostridia bacterium]